MEVRTQLSSRFVRGIYATLEGAIVALMPVALLLSSCVSRFARVEASSGEQLTCRVFPADNIWNTAIDSLPIDAHSADYIDSIGANRPLHADFAAGTWNGSTIGIPYVLVPGTQPKVAVHFDYAAESDQGPYPVPANALIEGGSASKGDRHVIVVDKGNCILYELYNAFPNADGSWKAGSGAIFDLKSNTLRRSGWTSADASGMPIFAGLVRYDEVASGEIRHALRFSAPRTRKEFIWPATHDASRLTDQQYPPLGQRFRLKASYRISGVSPEVQVILTALKKYGMFLTDNGSPWFISGAPDPRWDDASLHEGFRRLHGSDFEAVDEFSLRVANDSGQVKKGGSSATAARAE